MIVHAFMFSLCPNPLKKHELINQPGFLQPPKHETHSVKSNLSRAASSLELLAGLTGDQGEKKAEVTFSEVAQLLERMNRGDVDGSVSEHAGVVSDRGDTSGTSSSTLEHTARHHLSGSSQNHEHDHLPLISDQALHHLRMIHDHAQSASPTNDPDVPIEHPDSQNDQSSHSQTVSLVDIFPARRALSAIPEADSIVDTDTETIAESQPNTPQPMHVPDHITDSQPLNAPSPTSMHETTQKVPEINAIAETLDGKYNEAPADAEKSENSDIDPVEAAGLTYLADRDRHRRKSKVFRSSMVRTLSSMSFNHSLVPAFFPVSITSFCNHFMLI